MEEKKNGIVWVLVTIIIILLGVILYLGRDKIMSNNKPIAEQTTTTTTIQPTTTKKIEKPAELNNATIEEFYDVITNQKYYLAQFVDEANGDIYDPTRHIIYDSNYKKITTIPELYTSHIWSKNGKSIFGAGVEINVTAKIIDNKIYSLANNPNEACSFVQYESYIENGELKQKIVKTISDAEVNISGEKC